MGIKDFSSNGDNAVQTGLQSLCSNMEDLNGAFETWKRNYGHLVQEADTTLISNRYSYILDFLGHAKTEMARVYTEARAEETNILSKMALRTEQVSLLTLKMQGYMNLLITQRQDIMHANTMFDLDPASFIGLMSSANDAISEELIEKLYAYYSEDNRWEELLAKDGESITKEEYLALVMIYKELDVSEMNAFFSPYFEEIPWTEEERNTALAECTSPYFFWPDERKFYALDSVKMAGFVEAFNSSMIGINEQGLDDAQLINIYKKLLILSEMCNLTNVSSCSDELFSFGEIEEKDLIELRYCDSTVDCGTDSMYDIVSSEGYLITSEVNNSESAASSNAIGIIDIIKDRYGDTEFEFVIDQLMISWMTDTTLGAFGDAGSALGILMSADTSDRQFAFRIEELADLGNHCQRFDLLLAMIDPVNNPSEVATLSLYPSSRTQGILDILNNNLSLNADKINDAIQRFSEPGELVISEVVEGEATITLEQLLLYPKRIIEFIDTISKDSDIRRNLSTILIDNKDDGDGVIGHIIIEE